MVGGVARSHASFLLAFVHDATDVKLLDLLQSDASLSNLELAERSHTSSATALRRVRRLVDEGVVGRRVALLSNAGGCRPGPTSCCWRTAPIWRPTTRWCSASLRKTPTCAT